MKLTNPTDDELNAAFAEKVAGYTMHLAPGCEWRRKEIPHFTTSADAVLPWLEKFGWKGTSSRWGATCMATVVVNDCECTGAEYSAQQSYSHTQSPFPRAAVIALLRAHNVEIEFTHET